jgi:hypothetical protein
MAAHPKLIRPYVGVGREPVTGSPAPTKPDFTNLPAPLGSSSHPHSGDQHAIPGKLSTPRQTVLLRLDCCCDFRRVWKEGRGAAAAVRPATVRSAATTALRSAATTALRSAAAAGTRAGTCTRAGTRAGTRRPQRCSADGTARRTRTPLPTGLAVFHPPLQHAGRKMRVALPIRRRLPARQSVHGSAVPAEGTVSPSC